MSLHPGAPTVQPGDRLDRYELLCPVSQGGMAVVWVGRLSGKHGFEKLFAIKMIRPEFARDPVVEQMFLDEARLAARIQHPNVASIVELGDWNDILYIVMEWVDGDSVAKLIRIAASAELAVPVGVACRIIADTLGGLHAAHELRGEDGNNMGVIHRDVSPQNILVSVAGNTKLIDFGIAKARDRGANETTTGTVKGKFSYMSPEQASGVPVDRTADIWAAGAVLHHLLAGRAPFVGDNPLATLHALISQAPPPPLPAQVPPDVARVVRRALHRDVAGRYQTAEEMQRDLDAVMAGSGPLTTPTDVAAYVARLTPDWISARKNAIDIALRSLSERRQITPVASTAFPSAAHPASGSQADVTVTTAAPFEVGVETVTDSRAAGTLAMTDSATSLKSAQRPTRSTRVAIVGAGVVSVALALVATFVAGRHAGPRATRSAAASVAASSAEELPPKLETKPVESVLSAASASASAVQADPKLPARRAPARAPAPRASTPKPPPSTSDRNGDLGF